VIPSRLRRLVLACAFLLASASISSATAIPLDFEGLTDLEELTTQFPGLVFSNALVFSAGSSLNEFEFPPRSGSNVITDNGGPITIGFSQQVFSLAGYFTYITPVTLTAFDFNNNVIGSVISALSSNYESSLTPSPNELLAFNSMTGISSVTLSGEQFGGSFVLDDLTYDTTAPVGTVADSGSTLSLVILGAAGMLATRRS
jgi:hypothetical protein